MPPSKQPIPEYRECRVCGETKKISEFYDMRDYKATVCKSCDKKRAAQSKRDKKMRESFEKDAPKNIFGLFGR